MDKYGTIDVEKQQLAELATVRDRIWRLRSGYGFTLGLTKEAAASELEQLEERAAALEHAVIAYASPGSA